MDYPCYSFTPASVALIGRVMREHNLAQASQAIALIDACPEMGKLEMSLVKRKSNLLPVEEPMKEMDLHATIVRWFAAHPGAPTRSVACLAGIFHQSQRQAAAEYIIGLHSEDVIIDLKPHGPGAHYLAKNKLGYRAHPHALEYLRRHA
jgi:hypothetical protein